MTKSIYIKFLVAVTIIIVSNFVVVGQRNVVEFERISVEEGLSQSTVYSILQDHKGFLWFGTDDGLNLYDGYSFKVYLNVPGDDESLSNNRIIALLEDSKNRLWIGTIGGGLNFFDRRTEKFRAYRNNPNDSNSLSNDRIMALCEDPSGKIWVGTADGGLNLFDPESETFKVYINTTTNPNLLPSNVIRTIFINSQNKLFVGTEKGIAILNRADDNFTHIDVKNEDGSIYDITMVRRFYDDSHGNLWIATDREGLIKYNYSTEQFTLYSEKVLSRKLASNTIHDIYEDDEGFLWIASYGGLYRLDLDSGKINIYQYSSSNSNSLSSNLIRTVFEDDTGILWVGTHNAGISKYIRKYNKFTIYKNNPEDPLSLPSSTVRALYEDNDNIIWIGTYGEGLIKFNIQTEEFKQYKYIPNQSNSLPNNQVTSIVQDKNGYLWVATNGGITKLNPKSETFHNYYNHPNSNTSIPDNRVRTLFIDRNNTLWLSTINHGIAKLHPNENSFTRYRFELNNPKSISQDRVTILFEDNYNNFWLGTSSEGLNLFNRDKGITIKVFRNSQNDKSTISSNRILSIFQDSKNRLWIGTGSGLNLYNYPDSTFKTFTSLDGLPNDVILGILEDDNGMLWLSTNNGISRFDYSEPNTPKFRNFDKLDGLQSNEFSENACLKTHNGIMFFGGINNFSVFDPLKVMDNPFPPRVFITSARIIEKSDNSQDNEKLINLLELDELILDYYNNNLTINFAALHYSVPQKNSYKYMLEGFENSWVAPQGNHRFAVYTNLRPGKYTFRVIASNPDGVWNMEGDSIVIRIRSPFWMKWWFYILVSLLFAGIIFSLVRLRESGLIRAKRELEEMVAARTQEISSKSQEVLLQSEMLQKVNEEIKEAYDTLSQQNSELQAKNEEITSQRNDLEEQKNFLANLAWELQQKNDETTVQRNELEEQKNSLANLAWELQDKNEEITAQRNEIERQKKEITDSILYAQRIQDAILPTPEQIRDIFPEFFVLNKPKSIVSGDFYWATRIGKHRIVAVVDCTGHGVPGGFMSMLGVLLLNEVISLRLLTDPARALNQLRQNIISVLHQRGDIDDSADGMDLSLCVINDNDLTLTYSGANSSILVFNPANEKDQALVELRSDRMPIGYHPVMKSFTNQTLKLSKGTVLFMYSDGLVDQFGGPDGKKFQHAKLREFILQNRDLPIETQGIVLEQVFNKWKGQYFQVDDVLVMGLKV